MSYSPAKIEPEKDMNLESERLAAAQRPTPSWFSDMPARDLAEAYRARRAARESLNPAPSLSSQLPLRRRFEERFEERYEDARQLYDVPERQAYEGPQPQARVTRPVMSPNALPPMPMPEQPAAPIAEAAVAAATAVRSNWGRYAGMGVIALVIGSGIGYGFAKRHAISEFAMDRVQAASVSLPNFKAWSEAPATVVPKKEVTMASLEVNDARGTLNSMIPLMLHAAAGDEASPINIKISGLPPSAYLSAGQRSGVTEWTVKTTEMDGLKLVVPKADQNKLDLEVAALDQKSGALAAPVKSLSIALEEAPKEAPKAVAPPDVQIQPVAAPPDTSGNNFNNTSADGADYVAKGDALMKTGDIATARQFYMKASQLGNAKGTLGVAKTYDPKVFAELNVQGLQPDSAQAADWYKKASAAGVTNTP
jgi:hypothetical protein